MPDSCVVPHRVVTQAGDFGLGLAGFRDWLESGLGLSLSKAFKLSGRFRISIKEFFAMTDTFVASYC